ncbi:hypothetical protein [Corallococcus sp. EGB]|uniref:hypothetical protein n=1 Tax=Corallococcus sp. EGB TaxID=1521117 RepID=UPI001CBECE3D|nr:hypothetical protein [Corallococcus sp. EGB]
MPCLTKEQREVKRTRALAIREKNPNLLAPKVPVWCPSPSTRRPAPPPPRGTWRGGTVFLPLHAPWRDRYIAAHASAPKGEGMDAVDQQLQILLRWQSGTSEALYSYSLASLVGLG